MLSQILLDSKATDVVTTTAVVTALNSLLRGNRGYSGKASVEDADNNSLSGSWDFPNGCFYLAIYRRLSLDNSLRPLYPSLRDDRLCHHRPDRLSPRPCLGLPVVTTAVQASGGSLCLVHDGARMQTVRTEVAAVLRFYGVTEQVAHKLAANTSRERIVDCVEYMMFKGKIVKDKAAYLTAALVKGWQVPPLDSFSCDHRWDILMRECRIAGLLRSENAR